MMVSFNEMHVFFCELTEKQYIAYPILMTQKGTKLRQNSERIRETYFL